MLQVLQLKSLVVRGPVIHKENFAVTLDRVAIAEEEVQGALLCVQNVFRSPHFNQWKTPDEGSSVTKLDCVASSGHVTHSLEFSRGGRVSLFSTQNCLIQCSHNMTHFMVDSALFGKKYFCLYPIVVFENPGYLPISPGRFLSTSSTSCFGMRNLNYSAPPVFCNTSAILGCN